jgi:two-component system, sensor histidine kinase and response regulator
MARQTILVIENNPKIRRQIERAIVDENRSIVYADNDCQGISLARQYIPSLILCRFDDDRIDTENIVEQLQENWVTARIPLIFLTKTADFSTWEKFINWGNENFLIEPFTEIELQKTVFLQLAKQAKCNERNEREREHLYTSITRSLPHELRTAVTGILMAAEFLNTELESLDLSIVRETINCINSSGNRLAKLTQNFLLYGEIELLKTIPERIRNLRDRQTYFASSVVRDTANKLVKSFDRKQDLQLELDEASIQIGTDSLIKIIEELVDNACKFSEKGDEIRISSMCRQDDWMLLVSDRGRGMSAEQIERVGAMRQFDRQIYEQQGAGLGLAIAKSLAELYGGRLIIQSILHRGTIVCVYLPKANLNSAIDRQSSVLGHQIS